MTAPRPGGSSPVYGLFGFVDTDATSLEDLIARGAQVVQIPTQVLTLLEAQARDVSADGLSQVHKLSDLPFVGASGFDDWWNIALGVLSPASLIARSRGEVGSKKNLYLRAARGGLDVPKFISGRANLAFLNRTLIQLGHDVFFKPSIGGGSRGAYRYRSDLSRSSNLQLMTAALVQGHIDSQAEVLATTYINGPEASVEVGIVSGEIIALVVHEKYAASPVSPYVDRAMISPPVTHRVIENELSLRSAVRTLVNVMELNNGVLHTEWRLSGNNWALLDVGVRPGGGLVAHSVLERSGFDIRLLHMLASVGAKDSLAASLWQPAADISTATCIACCYLGDDARGTTSMKNFSALVSRLREDRRVFGWHLNVSELSDTIYSPDAGLSIGVTGSSSQDAFQYLSDIVIPFGFVIS